MKPGLQNKRSKARRVWIPVMIVLLLIAGGAGYFFWTQRTPAAQAVAGKSQQTQTSRVRRGSITLSTSGSGTLTAGKESALRFPTSGTVAEVNVQVGNLVEQGTVLAKLADLKDLQAEVNSAQQDLITAQQALETLKENAAANLANAQLDLIDAQEALADAKSGVVEEGWARCDADSTEAYYDQYQRALKQLEDLGDGGGNHDYYLNILVPAKNVVARAKAAYDYCAGFTDQEIASSKASLSLAEAQLEQAQSALDKLTENEGIDPLELASAENQIASAELALAKAEENLTGATLVAPFDGTILDVAGDAGDTTGTEAFITIADLAHPLVEFSVDETDLSKVAVGEQATVTFDAVPNQVFQGKVTRVNPALETVSGYQVIKGLIELELDPEETISLPKGLNGTVELVQATAENVLLAPLQAVRDLGDGVYGVFVVGADGQPKMKVVEVGLMDLTSAEIKSGLSEGDVVTTGIVETK